jgi:hypothetical protein
MQQFILLKERYSLSNMATKNTLINTLGQLADFLSHGVIFCLALSCFVPFFFFDPLFKYSTELSERKRKISQTENSIHQHSMPKGKQLLLNRGEQCTFPVAAHSQLWILTEHHTCSNQK